jgi:hypothetical protein
MIYGRLPSKYGIGRVVQHTSELNPTDVEQLLDVHIIDPEWTDNEFATTWYAKYGAEWPSIGEGRVHHGLCKLHGEYTGFELEWALRSQERERAFWAWFFEMHSTSPTGRSSWRERLHGLASHLGHASCVCSDCGLTCLQAHLLHFFRLLLLASVFVLKVPDGHLPAAFLAGNSVLQHASVCSHLPWCTGLLH